MQIKIPKNDKLLNMTSEGSSSNADKTSLESPCVETDQLYSSNEQMMTSSSSYRDDAQSDTIFTLIDDKNRTIDMLSRQLDNQKLQLKYYIGKEIGQYNIQRLSETCSMEMCANSLPLTLAMTRYYKDNNMKSKLLDLYDRMSYLDGRISSMVKGQRNILRRIVSFLCGLAKSKEGQFGFMNQLARLVFDPMQIEVFDRLLTSTTSLRRKIDSFNIFCNRVLTIEEERNMLVDHVYSLTPDDRLNGNYLLGVEMEKANLENKVRELSCRCCNSDRLAEFNSIETLLKDLKRQLNICLLENKENKVSKMLSKIHLEAQTLLDKTREQKRKHERNLSKPKMLEVNRIIHFLNLAANKEIVEEKEAERYGITTKEDLATFILIKEEVDQLKQDIDKESEVKYMQVASDKLLMQEKLAQLTFENNRIKDANKALQERLFDIRKTNNREVSLLQKEREALKAQLDDIQTSRNILFQADNEEKEVHYTQTIQEQQDKILELESSKAAKNKEVDELKLKLQLKEGSSLNKFIPLIPSETKPTPISWVDTKTMKMSMSSGQCKRCLSADQPSRAFCQREPFKRSMLTKGKQGVRKQNMFDKSTKLKDVVSKTDCQM